MGGDFCSDVSKELWDKNPNFDDSILAKLNKYQSYGAQLCGDMHRQASVQAEAWGIQIE